MATSELRRSSRSRKPVIADVAVPMISSADDDDDEDDDDDSYDKKISAKVVNRGRHHPTKKRSLEFVDDHDKIGDNDDEEDEDEEEEDGDDDASEKDDPSFDGRTNKVTKRKSPSPIKNKKLGNSTKATVTTSTTQQNATSASINPITKVPQKKQKRIRVPRSTNNTTATAGAQSKNTQNASLAVLVQKMVLPNLHDDDTTLFPSLLRSVVTMATNKKKNSRHQKKSAPTTTNDSTTPSSSQYTETIQSVVNSFINDVQTEMTTSDHQNTDETNVILIHLYNLIFSSVGGTTLLHPTEEHTLDDMTDEDWTNHMDMIVEEMSNNTSTSSFTITTKLSSSTSPVTSQQEFYTLYSEFWYHLTTMLLTSYNNSTVENEDIDDNGRFRVELVRQIISRLIELVNVGVPDIRYAIGIAIYQMGSALLQYTTKLQQKSLPVQRQYQVAQQNRQKKKASAMQNQIQLWKHTIADCEEIVKELIVTTVFTIRYKDHDPMIRKVSLQALHQYSMIRSDIFLSSFYLKYFGWMMSDKHPMVRIAAIHGLMKPLAHNINNATTNNHRTALSNTDDENMVDITSNMSSVITKFLPRIVDCVIDVDVSVQETAMEFVLLLLRHYEYFNDIENERMWNQINVRALDPHTSQHVRTNALYFVLEQLDVSSTTNAATTTGHSTNSSDRDVVTQLYAIGKWVAHTISDSKIPVSEIRYDLVDFIVMSLREMPEYKHYVSNHWNAMLRCVLHGDEHHARKSSGSKTSENRINIVTQRVMIRMLVTAVQFEVMNIGSLSTGKDKVAPTTRLDDDDTEFLDAQRTALLGSFQSASTTSSTTTTQKGTAAYNMKTQEDLTMALLRELPQLLVSFKSETSILQSLTTLPQYFLPSVLNLSSRKKDVTLLLSNMSIIYNESTDSVVLQNCCQTLVFCAKACHARSDMAILTIEKLRDGILSRLMNLFKKKSNSPSNMDHNDSDDEDDTPSVNLESSIRLCLLRLSILMKRWRCVGFSHDVSSSDTQLEELAYAVAEYLSSELQSRQYQIDTEKGDDESDDDDVNERLEIWSSIGDAVHQNVSKSVSDGFDLLLGMTTWRLRDEIQRIDNGMDIEETTVDLENHIVLRMRRIIEAMIKTCYDQFLPPERMETFADTHKIFSIKVQESALRVSGDIRTLFPRKWCLAKSPLLKALAIEDDVIVVGGGYRFIRSQEWRLKIHDEATVLSKQQKQDAVCSLLLPIARALGTNWETGSRKEAGAALLHVSGSGKEANELVQCMLRVLKKLNPVRLLEAQMSCLRQKFEEWAEDEPEEPGDRPTDAEMQEFEEKEQLHREKFDSLVTMSARFATSLGVGKIRDKTLNPALLGFVREGVRFAFSTDLKGSDEPLPLGCRLVFLSILTKYLMWIRPSKEYKLALRSHINSYEAALRAHSDYGDVFEDDLKCLIDFRKAGELGEYIDSDTGTNVATKAAPSTYGPTIARARTSLGSSVSSIRSKVSGSLDSIHEEDPSIFDDDNDDNTINGDDAEDHDGTSHSTPSPPKRPRTVYSARTQSSVASTIGPVFDTEDSDTGGSSSM